MEVLLKYWWIFLIIAISIAAVTYIRRTAASLQKEAEQIESDMSSKKMEPGTSVILDSGIHGTIKSVKESTCMVEIAPGVQVEVEKYGLYYGYGLGKKK